MKFKKYCIGGCLFLLLLIFGNFISSDKRDIAIDKKSRGQNARIPIKDKEYEEFVAQRKAEALKDILDKQVKIGDISAGDSLEKMRTYRMSPLRPNYNLFDAEGILTAQAVDALSLSHEDQLSLQSQITPIISLGRDLAKKNIQLDVLRSNTEKGLKVYNILPFEVQMAEKIDEVSHQLQQRWGADRAGEILAAVPVESYFNSFGRDQISFSIQFMGVQPAGENSKDAFKVQMKTEHPKKGVSSIKTFSGGSIDRYYPGLFDDSFDLLKP